jgi:hypothetical protein
MYLFSGKDTAFTVKGTRDFGTTREKWKQLIKKQVGFGSYVKIYINWHYNLHPIRFEHI